LSQYNSSKEETVTPITDELLQSINNEIRQFIDKKNSIITLINEQHKLLTDKMTDLIISPTLLNILDIKYSTISQTDPYSCNICNSWSGRNAAALSAHKRGCKKKVITNIDSVLTNEIGDTVSIKDEVNSETDITINETKKIQKKKK
jgi:hypothetical protein